MTRLLLIALLISLFSGCRNDWSKNAPTRDPEPDASEYDFSPELNDRTPRIIGNNINITYGTPGVMIIRDKSELRFIDLTKGTTITFRWNKLPDSSGPIEGAQLLVGLDDLRLASAKAYKVNDTDLFVDAINLKGEHITIVITGL